MTLLSTSSDMKVIAWPAFKTRYKNPCNWLLYSHMPETVTVTEFSSKRLLLERFDIFHLHWPVETLVRHPNRWVAWLRVLLFWLLLRLSKWRGTKIIWTIHDEKPHVVLHPLLADWVQARLVANTDGYINLCTASHTAVFQSLPALTHKQGFVIPHGHYRGCYPDQMSRLEARSQLNIAPDAIALLYLGYISPYKNVPHLISTFRQLPMASENTTLLIAGKADDEAITRAVSSAAEGADNIQLHLRFISDGDLQIFFKAADLVVLPFEEILNSGSLILALSFDRPVLAPELGAVTDWKTQVGADWIKTYRGTLTPQVLMTAVQALPLASAKAPLEALDWGAIAQKTIAAYRALQSPIES